MKFFKKKNPYEKGRKEWNRLLHMAHNVIPLQEVRSYQKDMKLLDLYLRKRNDDALFWHNIIMAVLTGMIVLLTAVNIWLTFYQP